MVSSKTSLATAMLVTGLTIFALPAQAQTLQRTVVPPVRFEKDNNIAFWCVLSDGGFRQTAANATSNLGIPLSSVILSTVTLSKGSARCVAAFLKDSTKPQFNHKSVYFTQKVYDGARAVLKQSGPHRSCQSWDFVGGPFPICVPAVVKGGDTAAGLTACFEIDAGDSSSQQAQSIVLTLGNVPKTVEADMSKNQTACSARKF